MVSPPAIHHFSPKDDSLPKPCFSCSLVTLASPTVHGVKQIREECFKKKKCPITKPSPLGFVFESVLEVDLGSNVLWLGSVSAENMMFFGRLLPALLAPAGTLARSEPVLHEMPKLPSEWKMSGSAVDAEVLVSIRFSLHQRHLDTVREIALQVSDPTSSMYGRFLSADDIRELTEPDPAYIAAVGGWLDAAGVSWTRLGEVVEAQLTVRAACVL